MSGNQEVTDGILDIAKKEGKSRDRIIGNISALLKNPQTPPTLKLFIVLVLLVVLGISFIITICCIHALWAFFADNNTFNPFYYVITICVMIFALILLSIPLILKSNTTEQSMRLDDNFTKIYNSRFST